MGYEEQWHFWFVHYWTAVLAQWAAARMLRVVQYADEAIGARTALQEDSVPPAQSYEPHHAPASLPFYGVERVAW